MLCTVDTLVVLVGDESIASGGRGFIVPRGREQAGPYANSSEEKMTET